ncbi:methyl-accepting chemotaxis protein [Jannaschia sp. LMIT008]|uniref:methyl-accepting chemotaxis protein n=1 Tax=Jannaschia maritima TaxID=3032585 RepID=UPI002810E67B|nr:methyl-accepting chemotaxis protein [Jannaschia sp. LMIT008]
MDDTKITALMRLADALSPESGRAEALRAVATVPEATRAQGARACMWIGAILLADSPADMARAGDGLRRAVDGLATLRGMLDAHAEGRHDVVRSVVARVVAAEPDLLPCLDRFNERCVPPADTADRSAFNRLMDYSFETYLPAIDRLRAAMDGAVEAERVMQAERAEAAHVEAQAARTRIARLTRIVRMISVNARIEAARAGEAGMAFKVIADEVTDLAGQVEVANTDVQTGIDGILRSYREV